VKRRVLIGILLCPAALWPAAVSQWVFFGSDHRLHYKADQHGNRIMDFSSAGYKGGGVRLPQARVLKTLSPVEGDNTAQIQAAIDQVAHAAPDPSGLRGAVLLAPGKYDLSGTIKIAITGVVLRGSGSSTGGTDINLTGAPHRFLEIRGQGSWRTLGEPASVTDPYLPSGSATFQVDNAANFRVGDAVLIRRPVTEAWVHFMGMDTLVRDGKPQTWIKAGSVIETFPFPIPSTPRFSARPPPPSLNTNSQGASRNAAWKVCALQRPARMFPSPARNTQFS
jgi:hypothetical protein